jgi:hypothetical protein
MSDNQSNAYSHYAKLSTDAGATAAAVDLLTKACGAGDETYKGNLLEWASTEDNLKKLRDKIKECAAG